MASLFSYFDSGRERMYFTHLELTSLVQIIFFQQLNLWNYTNTLFSLFF